MPGRLLALSFLPKCLGPGVELIPGCKYLQSAAWHILYRCRQYSAVDSGCPSWEWWAALEDTHESWEEGLASKSDSLQRQQNAQGKRIPEDIHGRSGLEREEGSEWPMAAWPSTPGSASLGAHLLLCLPGPVWCSLGCRLCSR